MARLKVGVIGARSMVGEHVLRQLNLANYSVVAYSRQAVECSDAVEWRQNPKAAHEAVQSAAPGGAERVAGAAQAEIGAMECWICVAPIAVLPEYFALLEASGARRVVALSSTSRFTKSNSQDPAEQALVAQLCDSEAQFKAWAVARGVEWVILRPTLIYDFGRDRNISEIARFIGTFKFFPLLGKGLGLRQPIHAEDVAGACLSAMMSPNVPNRSYNISGAETLTYRDMAARIFAALHRPPRFLSVPLWCFNVAVAVVRILPRYRKWSSAMAERMNRDLVFDHTDAARDLNFKPRGFELTASDGQPARDISSYSRR